MTYCLKSVLHPAQYIRWAHCPLIISTMYTCLNLITLQSLLTFRKRVLIYLCELCIANVTGIAAVLVIRCDLVAMRDLEGLFFFCFFFFPFSFFYLVDRFEFGKDFGPFVLRIEKGRVFMAIRYKIWYKKAFIFVYPVPVRNSRRYTYPNLQNDPPVTAEHFNNSKRQENEKWYSYQFSSSWRPTFLQSVPIVIVFLS